MGAVVVLQLIALSGACLAKPVQGFFSVRKHAGYPRPEKVLESLVTAKGGGGANHFCVVGYRTSSDNYAWVHWSEGRALVLWEPVSDPKNPATLATSRRFLQLDRDVVASEEELKGSTHLVTRQWVKQVQGDCDRHGNKFVIETKKPN